MLAIVDNNFSMWHRSALTAIAQRTAAEMVTDTGSQLTGKRKFSNLSEKWLFGMKYCEIHTLPDIKIFSKTLGGRPSEHIYPLLYTILILETEQPSAQFKSSVWWNEKKWKEKKCYKSKRFEEINDEKWEEENVTIEKMWCILNENTKSK